MPASGAAVGQKRKAPSSAHELSASAKRHQKFRDATVIPVQTADQALTKAGELNIASFIKTREFEINALDKSMKASRQILSTRAFQEVPRHLRRRTASHNAKKVPRRLRGRALREMIDDNTLFVNSKTRTPNSRLRLRLETAKIVKKLNQKRKTVRQKKREAKANAAESDPAKHLQVVRVPKIKKNVLAALPLATSKFKRRQISKSWLPTHLWHTKRAHMTKSTEPMWRMSIPLSPTEKNYRATHRASGSRGCIAWDMSYMATVGCVGTNTAIEGLLKHLKFHGYGWTGQKYNKWKSGSRLASGWVCKSNDDGALGLVNVLWCATDEEKSEDTVQATKADNNLGKPENEPRSKRRKTKLDRRIMIRIHPSAFHVFWQGVLNASKLQKPQVLVEDLRFEIGSIEITGPSSTEALANVLKPTEANEGSGKYWTALSRLGNPALLPMNATLSFDVQDPRSLPPTQIAARPRNDADETALHDLVVNWPVDSEVKPSHLFSQKARCVASKLPSQSAINRRKRAKPFSEAVVSTATDPKIPIILLAHRPDGFNTSKQGTWTLLAPWKCIDVIWRKLLFTPLASGSKPRFGGLRQKQQTAFEQCTPWYPADFPGTDAGKAWERLQSEKRFDEWIRRPPSRRIAWGCLDLGLGRKGELGRGWACDWEYLLTEAGKGDPNTEAKTPSNEEQPVSETAGSLATQSIPLTQRQRKAAKAEAERAAAAAAKTRRRNTSSPESDEAMKSDLVKEPSYSQLLPNKAKLLTQKSGVLSLPSEALVMSVKLRLLDKGTIRDAARIYRLPTVESISSSPAVRESDIPAKAHRSRMNGETSTGAQLSSAIGCADNVPNMSEKLLDLRSRWLLLERQQRSKLSLVNVKSSKMNHRGLQRKDGHHKTESLRHINVLPKNAPPEIYEQYGPKPLNNEEKDLLKKQELAVRMEEEKIWDTHVPCPGAEDLVGFVTTGGYNLAEGRSTAIGGVWLQKVLTGWAHNEEETINGSHSKPRKDKVSSKLDKKSAQCKERQRHLVVVRNTGESVGRLAVWELCE